MFNPLFRYIELQDIKPSTYDNIEKDIMYMRCTLIAHYFVFESILTFLTIAIVSKKVEIKLRVKYFKGIHKIKENKRFKKRKERRLTNGNSFAAFRRLGLRKTAVGLCP